MSKKMTELFNSVPIKKTRNQKLMEKINAADVAPLKDQKGVVTPQQWKFIMSLCDDEGKVTLKEAAIRAGYPKERATQTANDLTNAGKYPQVVAAIKEYRYELAEKYGTNFQRHMRDLQHIRDAALEAGNYGAAVSAEFRRGQALGTIYIERKEIRHGTIDSMSKDEVRKKLEEIKAMYGTPPQELLDITPDKIEDEIEDDQPTMLEAMKNGERSRRITVQKTEGEPAEFDNGEVGEQSGTGSTGLSDRSPEKGIPDDGAEGSDEREESQVEPPSNSVLDEPRKNGSADILPSGVASEGDGEKV